MGRTTFGDIVAFVYDPALPEPQAAVAGWLVRVIVMGLGAVA